MPRIAGPASRRCAFANERGTWLSVVPAVEPLSEDGEAIVNDVRDMPSPFGDVLVGGQSAGLVDSKSVVLDRLPLAIGLIAVATFVVLFMLFGSLLVPLKALVLNVLSLTATFGAMVWVFQDGSRFRAARLHGDRRRSPSAMPILMFCIAFGLSMDYEVFLLVPHQGRARPRLRYCDVRGDGTGAHRADRHRRRRARSPSCSSRSPPARCRS